MTTVTRKSTKVEKICVNCGKPYFVGVSSVIETSRFCSHSCKSSYTVKKMNEENRVDWAEKTCPQCGKQYSVKPSHKDRNSYCSKKCMDAARMRRTNFTCPNCGKEFTRRNSHVRSENSFCSLKCFLQYRPTGLERKVQAGLTERGIQFVSEYPVGPFSIDIFIPSSNLAIECDGNYWHERRASKDAVRDRYITKCGITVIRFPEDEINNHLEAVLDKIACMSAPHHR